MHKLLVMRTCPVPSGAAAVASRAMRATPTAAPRFALSADDARAKSMNLQRTPASVEANSFFAAGMPQSRA
jgi:hypothetical protein